MVIRRSTDAFRSVSRHRSSLVPPSDIRHMQLVIKTLPMAHLDPDRRRGLGPFPWPLLSSPLPAVIWGTRVRVRWDTPFRRTTGTSAGTEIRVTDTSDD